MQQQVAKVTQYEPTGKSDQNITVKRYSFISLVITNSHDVHEFNSLIMPTRVLQCK